MLKRGMGLLGLTAMLVMAVPAVRIQASEPGVITALSEKVYLEKSIGSTVLANVLQGSTVEIIFTEMDDADKTVQAIEAAGDKAYIVGKVTTGEKEVVIR